MLQTQNKSQKYASNNPKAEKQTYHSVSLLASGRFFAHLPKHLDMWYFAVVGGSMASLTLRRARL